MGQALPRPWGGTETDELLRKAVTQGTEGRTGARHLFSPSVTHFRSFLHLRG